MKSAIQKKAVLYRMVMPEHVCPYGLKARHLLHAKGYEIEDHYLRTRQQTDEFKQAAHVDTTPQVYIGDKRIGTYDDLRRFFGKRVKEAGSPSYRPIVALFLSSLAIVVSILAGLGQPLLNLRTAESFMALSMCLLALLKLQDVENFSTMFLNYDLLARAWVPYASIYPYAEFLAGALMLAGWGQGLAAPVALFIGTVGAASVLKAVYIDRRELKCACVGGSSNVPLGFVSLTENLMMVCRGILTLLQVRR
jgi:glutaredoxin